MANRKMPQNLDAEMSVLGVAFLDKYALEKIVEEVDASMFYSEANKKVFQALNELYKARIPIDITTVKNELDKQKNLNAVGGIEYLSEIIDSVATAANLEYYIKIVKEKALRRKLIETATDIISDSYEEEGNLTGLFDTAEKNILNVIKARQTSEFRTISDVLRTAQEQLETRAKNKSSLTGIPSGFYDLDKETAGFHEGELIIIAARPGMGKTAFALNVATNAAMSTDKAVAIFNLEMTAEQLVNRMISAVGQIEGSKFQNGMLNSNDWKKYNEAISQLAETNIYIEDNTSIIYFDLLVFKRKDFLGFIKKAPKVKKIKKNLNIKKTIIILLPIFSLIFTYVSWNVAVNLINIKTNSSTSVLEILFAFKNPSFMAWMPEFLATVKNIFVNYKYFILLTISLFMVVFNLIKVSKAKKIRYGIAFLLYLLAKVAYVLFLFLVCSTMINSFIAVEALRRYLYTLVSADIFLITYTLVQLSYNLKLSSIALLFLMVLFSTTDANYQVKDFISKKYTNDSIEYREQFNDTIEYLDDFDTENNIVYIISKTESIPYMFNYELTPETVSILNHNNINKIMNKKKYFVYSLNITTKEEQKFLNRKRKGDIYIYIYDFDEKQKVMYKNIFESPMENNRMYKISNINGVYKAIYSD